MDVKIQVNSVFQIINTNMLRIEPTGVALENAIRKPIHQAFKSVPKENYRKLYREISKTTHPDKIKQQPLGDPSDPTVLFHTKLHELAQTLNEHDKNEFFNASQQLVENYKDRLPDLADTMELIARSNPFQLINDLQKGMLATLAQNHDDARRYNLYIQYAIYVIQAIVNAILILCSFIILVLFQIAVIDLITAGLDYFSEDLSVIFLIYLQVRFGLNDNNLQTPIPVYLLFFIGEDAFNHALKEMLPVSQLADDHRYYNGDVEFSEEDSDETVLAHAKAVNGLGEYTDLDYMTLRHKVLGHVTSWQYAKILSLGFYNTMQAPLPAFEQGLTVKKNAARAVNRVTTVLRYYEINGITTPGYGTVNNWMAPVIHHIGNSLYVKNPETKAFEQLSLDNNSLKWLPSEYIFSSDSLFYYDTRLEKLSRLQLAGASENNEPKSQYVLYNNNLFHYNNFTNCCNKIELTTEQLNAFNISFPDNICIDALSVEQLAAIKADTEHSFNTFNIYALTIFLKTMRAICFVPFLLMESICHGIMFAASILAAALMFVGFAIKLGVTLLLNMPLYGYEAFFDENPPSESLGNPTPQTSSAPSRNGSIFNFYQPASDEEPRLLEDAPNGFAPAT